MRDEHLIYTDLPDGKVKILPEQGCKLYCKLTKAYLAEAIVKPQEIKWFVSEVGMSDE